ncbi:MAG: NPCBM/NEW2 domain-containing protein [Planctomycetaceae bacterium]|nr:NPCBM/NEW2 domain-containing protein [Planctomycetaceae bacterium]
MFSRIGSPQSFLAVVFLVLTTAPSLLAESPQVTVRDVQGKTHSGDLAELTEKSLTLSIENQSQTFSMMEVWEIQLDHARLQPHLWDSVVFLANGDRLLTHPETIDETNASLRWVAFPSWKSVNVPLETISGMVLDVPEIGAVRSQALRTVMNREQKADVVDFKNGDQASGEFLGLTDKVLRLNSSVGETPIERSGIRLVTMNRELISFPKPQGPKLLLSLTDGSQITANALSLENKEQLTVKATFGSTLDLPLSALRTVRPLSGRVVYLSDLKPAKYEHHPYLAGDWALKTDRNVLGTPLQLDGREYPKGVGMHSQSRVTYNLNGEYETFRATVGVDDAAKTGGSVVFVVEVDGKEVFRSKPQTAKNEAIPLEPISLERAKQLILRVEFAEFGDVLDYADWADAVLIRTKP